MIGSVFYVSYEWVDGGIVLMICGSVYLSVEVMLLIEEDDLFGWGIGL